ncbi:MAG: SDR family oxidoreductase [Rhodospirillaceae bacterium]|jgi:NAD(P)-dependent dehydrogenase (short-subunit alcohol dehydrogenase family)|nr:SDR family oxidoreductase [Rhodospirillaceae bacterium]MBT5456268.1 SDR family oxidoreductase [Rhodospirillaceae bacterium]
MTNELAGKIAIVTGGGRGLGRAMALGFAGAGAAGIVVTAARSPDQVEAVASEIEDIAGAGTALPLVADVTDRRACETVAAQAAEKFGSIHILVNNAGKGQNFIGNDRIPFWEADPEGWAEVVDTNVNGPFFMARAVIDHMRRQDWGRIINITKSRDSMHRPKNSPYGPTKAALEAMTLAWAQDLLETGVTVNSLAPGGAVDTAFVLPAVRATAAETGKKYFPADVIVPAAIWLASEQSDGTTGCRYVGSRWNNSVTPDAAAEGAREPAIFLPPKRDSILRKPWQPPKVSSN